MGDNNKRFACWGWETVDIINSDYKIGFRYDTLPFLDNSIRHVFCSHLIEHISDESASLLFNEIYRILESGGVFRVVCPDLDKVIKAYKENDIYFFFKGANVQSFLIAGIEDGKLLKESLLLHSNLIRTLASYSDTGGGPIVEKEIVDKKIKELDKSDFAKWRVSLLDEKRIGKDDGWCHVNAYDFLKLKNMLQSVGFSGIVRSSLGQSQIKEPRKPYFDLEKHDWISLYVEAV